MPSVAVKLYSVVFKLLLRHRLHLALDSSSSSSISSSAPSPPSTSVPSSPTFSSADGVATKDLHIDPAGPSSLPLRIFLPNPTASASPLSSSSLQPLRRNSFPPPPHPASDFSRRTSLSSTYDGYLPDRRKSGGGGVRRRQRRLPVIVQFHGGAFVSGGCDTAANDAFCRRIARLCDAIVVAVGYRLLPEGRHPAAFDDGVRVLRWLAKQVNLAAAGAAGGAEDERRIVDSFGASMVEPWIAAHADPTRCVLLGASCGANIADYVARRAVETGRLLDPLKVVAQVLMYPFFIGSHPTPSELKLSNAYFYDRPTCALAWKLFLNPDDPDFDHPAANPLVPDRGPPLKCMPPTLTVVAEHDWMKDRAIAYAGELRRADVDAPVLEYKDAVHEFATLDFLLKTPQAQACAEDVAIWVKKYISTRGHEFSY